MSIGDFLKQILGERGIQALKIAGIALIALTLLTIVLSSLNRSARELGFGVDVDSVGVAMQDSFRMGAPDAPMPSMRNAAEMMLPPEQGYVPGDESEAFEVKEYSAQIETRNADADCETIRGLKARTDIIFETANEYDRGCSYTFKVKKESVAGVLEIINGLRPRDLSENVYTIKREVDDFTSEITILEGKLASLDRTLAEATTSYENITALATEHGDVESLAKIIESKITIIERLTAARIETANALERVARAKAEALDRLEYTYFSVSVYENRFVDEETIKDSWKSSIQQFVYEANRLVQDMSVGLLNLMLMVVKFALYFVILLFVARFGWSFVQKVWHT